METYSQLRVMSSVDYFRYFMMTELVVLDILNIEHFLKDASIEMRRLMWLAIFARHGNNFIGMLKMSPIKAATHASAGDNIWHTFSLLNSNNQFYHQQSPATSKPRSKIVSIRWQRWFHSNGHIFQSVIYHEIRDKRFGLWGLFERRPYCMRLRTR